MKIEARSTTDAIPAILTALYHAETMLAKLPDVTTNWNGQRPIMTTRRALELVRAALNEATKED